MFVALGEDHADAGAPAEVALEPQNGEVGDRDGTAVVELGLVGDDIHDSEVPLTDSTGEPGAADDRDLLAVLQTDAAREEELHQCWLEEGSRRQAEVEDAGVLEEELSLFWKEEREARQVDLLLVDLGLMFRLDQIIYLHHLLLWILRTTFL